MPAGGGFSSHAASPSDTAARARSSTSRIISDRIAARLLMAARQRSAANRQEGPFAESGRGSAAMGVA